MVDYSRHRQHMIDCQLRPNDITDHHLIDVMARVAREKYVPENLREIAYMDRALDLSMVAAGRYMSAPHVFAKLVQLAQITDDQKILLIGAGAGYGAAVISSLAHSVVALESDPQLLSLAREHLAAADLPNVTLLDGELSEGAPNHGPFDAIIIDGRVEVFSAAMGEQLVENGRLVLCEGKTDICAAKLYLRVGKQLHGRFAFNAAAPALPGFAAPKEFVF